MFYIIYNNHITYVIWNIDIYGVFVLYYLLCNIFSYLFLYHLLSIIMKTEYITYYILPL